MKQSVKVLTMLFVFVLMIAAFAAPASAGEAAANADACTMFYMGAVHGINGERLGLPRELPVDVYLNGAYAFTFEFKGTYRTILPAGDYLITINLAGTQTELASLELRGVPGCVKMLLFAELYNGAPRLIPGFTELYPPK